jgi:hypothetical protein
MSSLTRDLQASRRRFTEAERARNTLLEKNEMLTWHDKLASCMARNISPDDASFLPVNKSNKKSRGECHD